jgi:hypothetical protein
MRRALIALVAASVALAAPAVAQQSKASELLAKADEIAGKVAKLRGLPARRPIRRGVLDREQIKKRLLQRIDEEYSPEEIAGEELALKRLGLLEPGVVYLDVVTKLLTSQVAGFYDPWEGRLYIASWASFGADMLLAHEIDHALQDQHFDLKKFMRGARDNADATAARQAVVEGDGTAVMMEFLFAQMSKSPPWGEPGVAAQIEKMMSSQAAAIPDAPFALREALVFPYAAGLRFVADFRKLHGWKTIDAIYAKPPLSTEHILHPESYRRYEKPIAIAAATPPALAGYQLRYDNVNGEKGLAILLEAHKVPRERAEEAAAGWGGDRLAVLTPPHWKGSVGGAVGLALTVWDTEADAIEFFEALSHAMPSLAGGGREVVGNVAGELIRYQDPAGGVATASRAGDSVVLILGAPPAREPDLRAAAMAWKRR